MVVIPSVFTSTAPLSGACISGQYAKQLHDNTYEPQYKISNNVVF